MRFPLLLLLFLLLVHLYKQLSVQNKLISQVRKYAVSMFAAAVAVLVAMLKREFKYFFLKL